MYMIARFMSFCKPGVTRGLQVVCVVRVVGGPFYSLRGRFLPSPCIETCQTAIGRIRSVFPPKLSGKTFHVGLADPLLPPLATVLLWYTAWWVLMSDGRCRGLVGRFGLICGPPFLMLRRTRSSATLSAYSLCFLLILDLCS